MPLELAEILREEAPQRLEQEVPPDVRSRSHAVSEPVIEVGHELDRLPGHCLLRGNEDRLAVRQEHQRVPAIGKIEQREVGARLVGEGSGLPDLEALEGAEHNESRRRHVP